MISEKEIKALKKYQFWKSIIKKEEHNDDDKSLEYCFSCKGCSGACSGCKGCYSCAGAPGNEIIRD